MTSDNPIKLKVIGKGLTASVQLQRGGQPLRKRGRERLARAAQEANAKSERRLGGDGWWADVQPSHLNPVYLATNLKTRSSLAVNDKGIVWGHFGTTRILIPWNELRGIEVGEFGASRGTQRSAFGFGPIGVAFVAATAVHNARARHVAQYRAIRISNVAGQTCDLVTPKSYGDVVKLLGPTADALNEHFGTFGEEATPASPTSLLGVADELEKLAQLHESGVLNEEEFETQKARLLAQ